MITRKLSPGNTAKGELRVPNGTPCAGCEKPRENGQRWTAGMCMTCYSRNRPASLAASASYVYRDMLTPETRARLEAREAR